MKKSIRIYLSFLFILPLWAYSSELEKLLSDLPFEMVEIAEPLFPDQQVNITEFGAIPGGEKLNTSAFAKAITGLSEKGGGKIIVPAGIWLTGPIEFKSNINLHLKRGAVILFSDKLEHFSLRRSTWEGLEEVRYISPVFGEGLENIAITGSGIIDGSGDAWRPVKKFKMTDRQWQELVASGGVVDDDNIWWPSEGAMNGAAIIRELKENNTTDLDAYRKAAEYLRPVMINFVNCKNLLLDGPTFQNSPAWNIHPLMCENIIIRNITVRNPWYSQNGDGLDLESCKNALVYNSSFDVGDDAICLKSGKNEYGRQRGMPSENIVIDNCIVYHGHGGFTVGSEMSGGIRNISVSNCTFLGTDVGLRFKSTRGRGGVVENIYIENIDMMNIPTEAIRFNMFYENRAPIPEDDEEGLVAFTDRPAVEVSEETPQFKNIHIKKVQCINAGQAILLQGLPEMSLKNMVLQDIFIKAKKGLICVDAESISMRDVTIEAEQGPSMALYNSSDILVENIKVKENNTPYITVNGAKSSQIHLKQTEALKEKEAIRIGQEVADDAVLFN